jgi:hypothetical protein
MLGFQVRILSPPPGVTVQKKKDSKQVKIGICSQAKVNIDLILRNHRIKVNKFLITGSCRQIPHGFLSGIAFLYVFE